MLYCIHHADTLWSSPPPPPLQPHQSKGDGPLAAEPVPRRTVKPLLVGQHLEETSGLHFRVFGFPTEETGASQFLGAPLAYAVSRSASQQASVNPASLQAAATLNSFSKSVSLHVL